MENRQEASLQKAKKIIRIFGAVSLVLAPLLSFIGWGMAHDSLSSFLSFNFQFKATDAALRLSASSDPALIFRYYLLPHYFMYSSMPVYIALGLTLMYAGFKKAPWHSLIGGILSIIGGVYFIGVLGAFLSAPIGSVFVTNILKISFMLCILVFVGNILLGISLYKTHLMPRWSPLLFITGNILILAFPGVENWMSLGSLMMLVAMIPLSRKIFRQNLQA